MELSARSCLTAGAAMLGAGAVAVASIGPAPGRPVPDRLVSSVAVDLAASIDPIGPWVKTIRTSLQNLTALPVLYLQQPLPVLTTIARNQLTYLKELPDVQLIASQVMGNLEIFFKGPYQPAPELISDAQVTTIAGLGISQQTVYGLLLTYGSDKLDPLTQFAASPFSGEVLGALGPAISPLIQLTESFTAVGTYFKEGKVAEAVNELINIPANTTNAFLNGGKYLDLTALVPKLGYPLPPEVTSIGLNMGGLLNVSPRAYEPPTLPGSDVHPYGGGVAFDALAVELNQQTYELRDAGGTNTSISDPGWPVGTIAPVLGVGQALGDAMLVKNQLELSGGAGAASAPAPAAPPAAASVKPGAKLAGLFKRARPAGGKAAATSQRPKPAAARSAR